MRSLLLVLFMLDAVAQPKMINPGDEQARLLWNEARLKAVIHVRANTRAFAQQPAYVRGTAFMVSDDYALTAAHVVCNESTRVQYQQIELSVGGPGAAGAVSPMLVECYVNGADIAIIRVPGLNPGRPHLTPGSWNSLKTDPFVTTYGYGGDQQGRMLHASSDARPDNANRLRATLLATTGDSGAPVLDRNGVAIGVLSAGNPATVAIVPILPIYDILKKLNVAFADAAEVRPTTVKTAAPSAVSAAKAVQGQVRIYSGPVDGKWPTPLWRPASADEATVLFTLLRPTAEAISIATDAAGGWRIPLQAPLDKNGVDYAATVDMASDFNRDSQTSAFVADPVYGKLTPDTVGQSIAMDAYARPAYVGRKYSAARKKAEVQNGSPQWKACAKRFEARSPRTAACPDATLKAATGLMDQADADYERALNASFGMHDFELTNTIGANWSAFKLATSRPCQAAMIMKTLADKSSARPLPPTYLGQTLNMVGSCHGLATSWQAGAMPWRAAEETPQVAAVRLMNELLERYAADVTVLRPVRKHVALELVNAFERYHAGAIKAVDAARTINENDVLFRHLTQFVPRFFDPLCGKANPLPKRNAEEITKTLKALRSQVADCT